MASPRAPTGPTGRALRAGAAASDRGRAGARVVILGAGPAGAGAAYRLAQRRGFSVTVLEQRDTVGGNAGSFTLDGISCDYGSHRLHPVVEPEVMRDMEKLLGDDLLWRVRHGTHPAQGPLDPLPAQARRPDCCACRPGFALSIVRDLAGKLVTPHLHG